MVFVNPARLLFEDRRCANESFGVSANGRSGVTNGLREPVQLRVAARSNDQGDDCLAEERPLGILFASTLACIFRNGPRRGRRPRNLGDS
jgi:hypothetical protein